MKIVPVEDIPKEMADVPLDNLNEIYITGKKMEAICLENNGIGISAAQVGIPWNFFIYCVYKKDFRYMVNCKYEPLTEEKFSGIEGCLSILDSNGSPRRFKVLRHKKIKVSGYEIVSDEKLNLEKFERTFTPSLESILIQHEIDHQEGVLISDIGEEVQVF